MPPELQLQMPLANAEMGPIPIFQVATLAVKLSFFMGIGFNPKIFTEYG